MFTAAGSQELVRRKGTVNGISLDPQYIEYTLNTYISIKEEDVVVFLS